MIYRDFQGKKLSALGFGAMRLPVIKDKYNNIDETAAGEMVDYAIRSGINYFDTAWGYHDGKSETVLGKLLSKYARDKFYLASKFPGYDISNMDKVDEIFQTQLKKCKVDYFDFYLFHNVCELNIEAYLDDEKYGLYTYLKRQKESGKIKHLGFSAHGSYAVIKRFLNAYAKDMEFCQLQINYLDWSFQSAKEKMELLNEYNIPIWVMEPLRGGRLASLKEEEYNKLKLLRPNESAAAWAFRFLQTLPNVKMILSGMSDFEQLKENIKTFQEDKHLSDNELKTLFEIANEMVEKNSLPCTKCHYCTAHCPKQLDIPYLAQLYNEHCFTGGGFIAPMAMSTLSEDKKPSACAGCRSCEKVCPQGIKISEMMADFVKKLNG